MSNTEGKYIIHATIRCDGTVARKDVVGAIFGQTEGLLGDQLQLRKLQRTGRIGHVDVCLLYTSPSPRDLSTSRMPSSA